MKGLRYVLFWSVLLGLPLSGCAGSRKSAAPRGTVVPLKVWAVVAQDEFLGDRRNMGCRLSHGEIVERIQYLQRDARIFGPNVRFNWPDGNAHVIDDPTILA
jgi:hypothetical protein